MCDNTLAVDTIVGIVSIVRIVPLFALIRSILFFEISFKRGLRWLRGSPHAGGAEARLWIRFRNYY